MRQEPIEISLTGRRDRNPLAAREQIAAGGMRRLHGGAARSEATPKPAIVDEAFARLDGFTGAVPLSAQGNGRSMRRALVSDLAAQLEAIDRQRERLARLLESVETNSIAE